MNQPPNTNQNVSSNKTKIILIIIFLAILLLAFGILVGLVLRRSGFQFSMSAAQTPVITTPPCIEPTLMLGTTMFHVKSLPSDPNTYPPIPPDTPDTAYWVEGTTINYVFGLSATPSNLTLGTSLRKGDLVSIRWADCRLEEYIIKSIENGSFDTPSPTNQSAAGATIFVQTGSTAEGILIRSGRPEAQMVDTPNPEQSEIEAEISFLDTTVSPDGTTIRMGISILNNGTKAFTLSTSDISLTPENAEPLASLSVEPPLPREIQPGATEIFYITFPRATTSTALLRILIFSIDIEVP
jgi:hypothetical protein